MFLPNIWVCNLDELTQNNINNLKKTNKILEIKEAIKIYNDINYWHYSRKYNLSIRKQILNKEINDLKEYYKKTCKLIENNFINQISTIIISKNIDLLFGLMIFFNIYISKLDPNNSLKSVQTKLPVQIIISAEMKLLFQNINI